MKDTFFIFEIGEIVLGNTFFYQEASKNDSKITWKDIFSESLKKHTGADMEYALSAGTRLNSATEADMLQKWQKPWLGVRVLGGGIAVCVLLYFLVLSLSTLEARGSYLALAYLCFIIPPFVSALAVMIFLWELNIPRNISIYSMMGYFLLGGILSIAVTYLLQIIGVPSGEAPLAPLVEEPAKLIISALFLMIAANSGKKIYGLTGLAVGAGVGAGFTAFESIYYAFNAASTVSDAFLLAVLRSFPLLGGHILFCAPYAAGLALGYRSTKSWGKALLTKWFLIPFLCSCLGHFLWNANALYIMEYAIAAALWYELLYMTRKCLAEAVHAGRYTPGISAPDLSHAAAEAGTLTLSCLNGPLSGSSWQFAGGTLTIGRDVGCTIQLPAQSPGVSRRHCQLEKTPQGWTITDLTSSHGTYLTSGQLYPGQPRPLIQGEIIYLGSKQFAFRAQIS